QAGSDFVEALVQCDLPGNARQVENLVWRALAHKEDETPLGLADLPSEVLMTLSAPQEGLSPAPATREAQSTAHTEPNELGAALTWLLRASGGNLMSALNQCERMLLEAALDQSRGNQSRAARLLGITPRSVYSKLRRYRLAPSR